MPLQELQTQVTKYFTDKSVKRVFVFGSFLEKGDAANNIDLIAEIDYAHKLRPGFFDRMDWQDDLRGLLHKEVDLLSEGGDISLYFRRIEPIQSKNWCMSEKNEVRLLHIRDAVTDIAQSHNS